MSFLLFVFVMVLGLLFLFSVSFTYLFIVVLEGRVSAPNKTAFFGSHDSRAKKIWAPSIQ